MSIKYKDLSSVGITSGDGVKIASLNAAFRKLVENDVQLLPTAGIAPRIWEATWYGNPDNLPGYSRGAAVWLNTESIDDLVRSRAQDIQAYAQSTEYVKRQIDEALEAEDDAAYYSILKQFALGLYPGQRSPIYYIGELTDKAQIRVSKVDDNKDLPTEDATWEDFFIRYGDGLAQQQVISAFDAVCGSRFEQHEREYHLPGVDVHDLSGTYLLNDLTNLENCQKFSSHYWYSPTMTGLDHVKAFVMKKFSNGRRKWFRVWASGLLEHGGTVDPSDPSGTGDSVDGRKYTVSLRWKYDGGTSPYYDYPPEGLTTFYSNDKYYLNGSASRSEIQNPDLGYSLRYTVSLSPSDKTERTPYAEYSGRMYDAYDVCFMNNADFSFVANGTTAGQLVTYSVRGYSLRAARY